MPHSSGGGSHGGGSHGGHGGSHSSSSRTRTSSRPFHNSRRYVYYHRNQPRYFYAGSDFKPGFSFATVFAILIYLPFLWVSISGIIKAVPHIPKYSDHTIIIKDEADAIDDESGVMKELKAFQKKQISHLPLSLFITTTGKIPILHLRTMHTTGIFPNSVTKCTGS